MGNNEMTQPNTTSVTTIVTDQGNGSTRCDHCDFNFKGSIPRICPSCARTITDHLMAGDFGGSDF